MSATPSAVRSPVRSAENLVLGIETSCDETAAAVVAHTPGARTVRVLSNVVLSQIDVHAEFGGVVPEVASRQHLVMVIPAVRRALQQAGLSLSRLDAIAVTHGPGLVGALLVGVETAKALAYAASKPLIGVNHLAGHLAAVRLDATQGNAPDGACVALLVSGGHTALLHLGDDGAITKLGATRDDAAGEAYDKVGKLLGLGYPAGAHIDRLAATGRPDAFSFPRALPGREDLDFSFSGVKTALATFVQDIGGDALSGALLADVCASFQAAVVDVLVRKARVALRKAGLRALVVAGGVAANSGLRAAMARAAVEDGFDLFIPRPEYCTDNAAMIAAEGALRLALGAPDAHAHFALEVDPGLPLPRAALSCKVSAHLGRP